jgi:hypothetical protein
MDEKRKRTEEERWDDCLSDEHDYEPGGEMPEYLREFVEQLREREEARRPS